MKLPMPNWELAQAAVEGYAEDGVRGKVGYDPDAAQWYADLNDEDYEEYMANLRKRHNEMCKIAKEYAEHWDDAVNIQSAATEPPKEKENRLALYLVDINCKTVRGFKVKNTLQDVIDRKLAFMAYGSTCENCSKRMMAILTWEDVKPKGKLK